jgi:hypothetical protein
MEHLPAFPAGGCFRAHTGKLGKSGVGVFYGVICIYDADSLGKVIHGIYKTAAGSAGFQAQTGNS